MKIFIGGLSFSTTDDTLRAYFKDYGTITDAVVMKDSLSRRSRGFGFITFAHPSSVDIVLSKPEHVIDNRRVEAKRAVPRADTGKAPDPASGIARPSVPSTWNGNGGSVETCATSPETVLPGSPNRVREIGRLANDCGDALKTGHQQAAGLPCAKVFVGGLHYDTRDSEFRTYFEKFGKVISAEVMFNRETRKSRGFGFVVFESVESAAAVLKFTHHTIGNKLVEVKPAIPRMISASGTTTSSPNLGPQPQSSSPEITTAHSTTVSYSNGTLGNGVSNVMTVSPFVDGTYATAAANGLAQLQRGGMGGSQQLQPGQETHPPLFPTRNSSPSIFDKAGSVPRVSTDWRDIVNGSFVGLEGGTGCDSEKENPPKKEDIPPSTFLQQVLNGPHQGSSVSTASVSSFSVHELPTDSSMHGGHTLGANLSPFLMGTTQPPQPLNGSHAQQWQNTPTETTAEGMIQAAMADLNLGFGLQDNWGEGNGCPFPELDLNNIIPSGQMDMKSPPVESLDTSITGSSFSEQRMTQGSVPEQLNTPVPGEDMPLYGLLGS